MRVVLSYKLQIWDQLSNEIEELMASGKACISVLVELAERRHLLVRVTSSKAAEQTGATAAEVARLQSRFAELQTALVMEQNGKQIAFQVSFKP